MARTLLAAPGIETGKKILDAFDDAKLEIGVAMWAVFAEWGITSMPLPRLAKATESLSWSLSVLSIPWGIAIWRLCPFRPAVPVPMRT
jgi:hypothetical protein